MMKDINNIPKEELEYIGNNSIFKYQISIKSIKNRDKLFENFLKSDRLEDLQMLDNGTVIICQNKFGGNALLSEFTCGYYFCTLLEMYLDELKSGKRITIGSDDYHSGWDYDFNLKFEQMDTTIKVFKDFDYKTEIQFEKESFYHNLDIFIKEVKDLFHEIYPRLKSHPS